MRSIETPRTTPQKKPKHPNRHQKPLPYILTISYNAQKMFRTLTASSGGGGGPAMALLQDYIH